MTGRIVITCFKTKFGELIVGSMDDKLCLCDWRYRKMREAIDDRIQKGLNAGYVEERSETIEETISQLFQYFNGERTQFDLPLLMVGSAFQKQVWNALLQIPFGKTVRAVAAANGANAISIIVPCHRILGSDGRLTGYAGGLETKKRLLQLENAFLQGELDLFAS